MDWKKKIFVVLLLLSQLFVVFLYIYSIVFKNNLYMFAATNSLKPTNKWNHSHQCEQNATHCNQNMNMSWINKSTNRSNQNTSRITKSTNRSNQNTSWINKSTNRNINNTCIQDVKCMEKPFKILKSIRSGKLKPASYLRTVFLKTIGRFGNLMYQFAFLLSFSKVTCAAVKVCSVYNNIIRDSFEDFPFDLISKEEYKRLTKDIPTFNNPNQIGGMITDVLKRDISIDSIVLRGFDWSSGCFDEVRHKLRLKSKFVNKAKNIFDEMVAGKGNVTTVGIHIRRGDKATNQSFVAGYRLAKMTYFKKAISHFEEKYQNVIFIVATDGREWVEENFPKDVYPNVLMTSSATFQVHFAILTLCDHVIQSGGTFGEWAAYFNGGHTTYFRDARVCPSIKGCDPSKYKPPTEPIWPGWVPMTND